MDWKAKRPRIEIVVECGAACVVGAAVGFALLRLGAGGIVVAGAAGVATAAMALCVLALVDRDAGTARSEFALVDLPLAGDTQDDVLLLDAANECHAPTTDELLLDDPLPLASESRVVRLFTAAPDVGAGGVIPAPGEMLARIETFLGTGRGSAFESAPPAHDASVDASAALHAALADIRASLRRG